MDDEQRKRFAAQSQLFGTFDEVKAREAIEVWLRGDLGLDWGFEGGSQAIPVKDLVRVKHPTIYPDLKDFILARAPEDAAQYGSVGKKAIEDWFIDTQAFRNFVHDRGTQTESMLLQEIERRMERSLEAASKNVFNPLSWARNIQSYFER